MRKTPIPYGWNVLENHLDNACLFGEGVKDEERK